MVLDVYIDNKIHKITVPKKVIEHGQDFFAKMDKDMDQGWKMGPQYIENPDKTMRAQIAAAKLLVAIENDNETLAHLMAGYIVTSLPGVEAVNIDMQGEPLNTEFIIK